MSKYTITIEGDFEKGECWKCPLVHKFCLGCMGVNTDCALNYESENCPLEEVKRGEWYDKGSLSCRCSNCGCKNAKETNFCPNCGADMRGGKE